MNKYRIPLKVYIYWSKCGLDVICNYDSRKLNKKNIRRRNKVAKTLSYFKLKGGIEK